MRLVIVESIVTTVDEDGQVNIAPMGPQTNPKLTQFVLRPFTSSRTYANLVATGRAVIHVTDDVKLFAAAAIDAIDQRAAGELVSPIGGGEFQVLKDCHRWFAVEVVSVDAAGPRVEMPCRVVDSGTQSPFFGFNRAKHAVIEAAILATRTGILPAEEIRDGVKRLRPLIDKTAGHDEHEAFEMLTRTIDERLNSQ